LVVSVAGTYHIRLSRAFCLFVGRNLWVWFASFLACLVAGFFGIIHSNNIFK